MLKFVHESKVRSKSYSSGRPLRVRGYKKLRKEDIKCIVCKNTMYKINHCKIKGTKIVFIKKKPIDKIDNDTIFICEMCIEYAKSIQQQHEKVGGIKNV